MVGQDREETNRLQQVKWELTSRIRDESNIPNAFHFSWRSRKCYSAETVPQPVTASQRTFGAVATPITLARLSHNDYVATALGASSSSKKDRPAWERPLTFYAAVRAATSITRRRPRAAGLPPRLRLQAAPAAAARLPPDPRPVRSRARSGRPETRARRGAPAAGPC